MNNYHLFVLFLLIGNCCAFAQPQTNATKQQSLDKNALTCYMCASASTGVLKSAAMTVKRDGGNFEKLENGESVLKLSRGDFVEFGFTLPKTACEVKATIKYHAIKEMPCFIRWNNVNPSENETQNINPKKKENLYYKVYELNNQQRNNILRITSEGNEGLKFYNITITYKYFNQSQSVDNFCVTLNSPDPAKSITDYNKIEFKWTGVGDCPKEGGWMAIQFCDNNDNIWKTVPGAEYIDLNGKDWKETSKGVFEGKMDWDNHGLIEMPDFRIVFTKGSSPVKKAKALENEATLLFKAQKFKEASKKYRDALDNIKQALKGFPQNEEYKSLRIKIARELNPFDTECRKNGDKTSVVINHKVFTFVFIKMEGKDFWILNQEVSNEQWKAIVKVKIDDEIVFKDDKSPVENVSWDKCRMFCNIFKDKLCNKYDNAKQTVTVTLPTSAQWGRAGQQGGSLPKKDVHFNNNFIWGAPVPVGVTDKPCNQFGIYGMQGNVAEWCLDGKKTSDGKDIKFVRGGSCKDSFDKCQINSLQEKEHSDRDGYTGFRFIVIPQ